MCQILNQSFPGKLSYCNEGSKNPSSQKYSKKIRYDSKTQGIMLGRGYTLCNKNLEDISKDLKMIFKGQEDMIKLISKACGLIGNKAKQYFEENKEKIILNDKQELQLFGLVMTRAISALKTKLTEYSITFDSLPDYQQDILIDLMFSGYIGIDLNNQNANENIKNTTSIILEALKDNKFDKIIRNENLWKELGFNDIDRIKRRKAYTVEKPKHTIKNLDSCIENIQNEQLSGVSLTINPSHIQKLPSVTGARIDFNSGNVEFIIKDNQIQSSSNSKKVLVSFNLEQQGINIDDLVIPLKIYYDPNIKCKSISFSLDPEEPTNPEGDFMKKVYYPDELEKCSILQGTKFGEILFEADYILKQLALGICPNNLTEYPPIIKEFDYPKELLDLGLAPTYKLRRLNNPDMPIGKIGGNWNRMWIVIKDIDIVNAQDEANGVSFFVKNIKMGIEARQMMQNHLGKLEDCTIQESNSVNKIFADKLTTFYDVACKYYPSFERLKQISKAITLAKWFYENRVPIDLNLINKIYESQRASFIKEGNKLIKRVPSLCKKEENIKEEIKEIPIDIEKIAREALKKHNLPVTEENIQLTINKIKESNKGKLVNKEIRTYKNILYIFGGVCLDLNKKLTIKREDQQKEEEKTNNESLNHTPKILSTNKDNSKINSKNSSIQASSIKQDNKSESNIPSVKLNMAELSTLKRIPFTFLKQETCTTCEEYLTLFESSYPVNNKYYCKLHHPCSCSFCYNIIANGKYFQIKDQKYHPNCIICIHCDQTIQTTTNQSLMFVNEGFIHCSCHDDYIKSKISTYGNLKKLESKDGESDFSSSYYQDSISTRSHQSIQSNSKTNNNNKIYQNNIIPNTQSSSNESNKLTSYSSITKATHVQNTNIRSNSIGLNKQSNTPSSKIEKANNDSKSKPNYYNSKTMKQTL